MIFVRRDFLIAGTGLAALTMLPGTLKAAGKVRYLTAARDAASGNYIAAALDDAGNVIWEFVLPARGHDFAVHPAGDDVIAMGRRPSYAASVLELATGKLRRTIEAVPGRHFYGHAVYTPDGKHLLATENAFDDAKGVIGVYDAAAGYKRLGEFESAGLDPHQIALMPDGRTAVIANGGIRTHPKSGRETLNLDTMSPSLAYVDVASGKLVQAVEFDDGRQRKLSMHHLAVMPDGAVAVGCQDQGPAEDGLPLVVLHRRGEGKLGFLQMPDLPLAALDGYCGSVAATASGDKLAVSSPKGGIVAFWDMPSGKYIGMHALADVCGLAADGGNMLITSGMGTVDEVTPGRPGRRTHRAFADRQWDNHVRLVGL